MQSARGRLVVIVLLVLVPALGATIWTARKAVKLADASPVVLARLGAAKEGQLVEGARQLLAAMATDPRIATADGPACSRSAAQLLKRYQGIYTSFARADADGVLDCSAVPATSRVTVNDRLYYRRSLASRRFSVGEYQIGRVTGVRSIAFGQPVREGGRVRAVLIASMDLKAIARPLEDVRLRSGATLAVTDGSGVVLARSSRASGAVGKPLGPRLDRIRRSGASRTTAIGGRRFTLATVENLPSRQNLYVVASAPVRHSLRYALAAIGLFGAVALALAWVVGGRRS